MRAPRRRAMPATRGAFDDVGGTTATPPRVAAKWLVPRHATTRRRTPLRHVGDALQIGYRRSHHFRRSR